MTPGALAPVSFASKRLAGLFLLWGMGLLAAILLSVFLHESGHGLGAKIDGIHVSTGFNKVGNPGKAPDEADFRTNMPDGFWTGLLGPITTWGLAIVFTAWLYRFKAPSPGALAAGMLALVNGLIRAIPMTEFLAYALTGRLHLEDEVGWSLWYALKFCHPALASVDTATLVKTQAALFLAEPMFWAPPLLSLAISLVCLCLAYRQIYKLWRGAFALPALAPGLAWAFGLLPVGVYFVALPVLNSLDRLIRINW